MKVYKRRFTDARRALFVRAFFVPTSCDFVTWAWARGSREDGEKGRERERERGERETEREREREKERNRPNRLEKNRFSAF